MQRLIKTLVITLLTAASATLAAAPVGYSINSDSSTSEPDSLYTINLANGSVIEDIGVVRLTHLAGDRRMDVEGLAFAPDGTLFGIDDESLNLFSINPANALVDPNRDYKILPGVLTPKNNDFGMTFTCDGTLYVTSVSEHSLYKIELTGVNTATALEVGDLGATIKIGAIAAFGSPPRLYGLSNGTGGANADLTGPYLYEIDTTNGQILSSNKLLGSFDKSFTQAGLGFDESGQLWAITDRSPGQSSQVLKINGAGTPNPTAVEVHTMTEQGFESLAISAPAGCASPNPDDYATFVVQKQFTDGNNITPVTFNFECTSGTVFNSSKTIFPQPDGFGPNQVSFNVGLLPNGVVDCFITEEPVSGYTPEYQCQSDNSCSANQGAGPCSFQGVKTGQTGTCLVRNRVDPVKLTVTKEWDVSGMGGDFYNRDAEVILYCDAPIVEGHEYTRGIWRKATSLSDPDSYVKDVDGTPVDVGYATVTDYVIPQWYEVATPPEKQRVTECWADENSVASAVEAESDCGTIDLPGMAVPVGGPGTTSCTILNTVFFEGIPTLNPIGLALISALMLLTGLVSVRRIA